LKTPAAIDKPMRVFLDGAEQKHCVEADEENGVVIVFALDKDGRYILDGDEIQTEIRYGVVTVVPA
jgi:hypothetical protein